MRAIALTILAWLMLASSAAAQAPTIEDFTRELTFWSARLSPDGRHVAGIARRGADDVLVVLDWRSGVASSPQRGDAAEGVKLEWVRWKSNDRLIFSAIYEIPLTRRLVGRRVQSDEADEFSVQRVFAIDRTGGNLRQMFEGEMRRRLWSGFTSTNVVDSLPHDPDHVLMSTYDARGDLSLFRADLATGRVERTQSGRSNTIDWYVDGEGAPVIRVDAIGHYGSYRIFRRDPAGSEWIEIMEVRATEYDKAPEFSVLQSGPGAGRVYVIARPEGEDRAAVYLYNTATGELGEALYRHPGAEQITIWRNPRSRALWAGCALLERTECTTFDPDMSRHLAAIDKFFLRESEVRLIDSSDDGATWLLIAEAPTLPPAFFVYDRAETRLTFLASVRPQLRREQLAPVETITYPTRDGARLWGYLTVPRSASGALPLIVMPHGGPEARDVYGFDELVQFLASRGYLVFQPQFRGSGGFGRAFGELGYRQWGQRMQDDVTDGVRHLIESGRADARRICIVGASYGGYAALAGAAFTPDLYRCAVSWAGVSDLLELVRDERRYGGPISAGFAYVRRSIGDPDRDRDMLIRFSPRHQAQRITIPILLIHGQADAIVPYEQSVNMEKALREAGKQVRLIPIPHGGHSDFGWEPDQRAMAYREIESFLAAHLNAPP